jgi:hypothetical protein
LQNNPLPTIESATEARTVALNSALATVAADTGNNRLDEALDALDDAVFEVHQLSLINIAEFIRTRPVLPACEQWLRWTEPAAKESIL